MESANNSPFVRPALREIITDNNDLATAAGGSAKQSPRLLNNKVVQIEESRAINTPEPVTNSPSVQEYDIERENKRSQNNLTEILSVSSENEHSRSPRNKCNILDLTFDNNENAHQSEDKQNNALSVATSSSSCNEDLKNVSSDDEIFDECQSFLSISTNATQMIDKSLGSETRNSMCENLVSSVTSSNLEGLTNTTNVEILPDELGMADSTTNNSSVKLASPLPTVNISQETIEKTSTENEVLLDVNYASANKNSSKEADRNILNSSKIKIPILPTEESIPASNDFPTKILEDILQNSFPTTILNNSLKPPLMSPNTAKLNIEAEIASLSNVTEENSIDITLDNTHDKLTLNTISMEQELASTSRETDCLLQHIDNASHLLGSSNTNPSFAILDHNDELTASDCTENSNKEIQDDSNFKQMDETFAFGDQQFVLPENDTTTTELDNNQQFEEVKPFENRTIATDFEEKFNNTFDSEKNEHKQNKDLHCHFKNTSIDTSPMVCGIENVTPIKLKANNSYEDEDMEIDMSCASETENVTQNYDSYNRIQVLDPIFNSAQNERCEIQEPTDEDFQCNGLILNPSDFEYLSTKGNNNVEVDRSSLLLRFDPLLGVPVPLNIAQTQSFNNSSVPTLSAVIGKQQSRLSPAVEEDEFNDYNCNPSVTASFKTTQNISLDNSLKITTSSIKKHAAMSVDLIKDMKTEHDIKSIDNFDSRVDGPDYSMDGLQKKIKNEVIKSEEDEKRNKDAEQREEALLKRITEKEKTMAKMNGVIEAYEKAIAELIAEKEQIIQKYEAELSEVKSDRDSNYRHLTSLETTFSDLHVKYEKSKEMTTQLKNNEETLKQEKMQNLQNLRLQEQRYDKMKNHAMQQLEIANKKLESLTRNHFNETTKLKALLKKEEVSRASMQEQLNHKSRENEELVKICDELINGQGS